MKRCGHNSNESHAAGSNGFNKVCGPHRKRYTLNVPSLHGFLQCLLKVSVVLQEHKVAGPISTAGSSAAAGVAAAAGPGLVPAAAVAASFAERGAQEPAPAQAAFVQAEQAGRQASVEEVRRQPHMLSQSVIQVSCMISSDASESHDFVRCDVANTEQLFCAPDLSTVASRSQ